MNKEDNRPYEVEVRRNSESDDWQSYGEMMSQPAINRANAFYGWTKVRRKYPEKKCQE